MATTAKEWAELADRVRELLLVADGPYTDYGWRIDVTIRRPLRRRPLGRLRHGR